MLDACVDFVIRVREREIIDGSREQSPKRFFHFEWIVFYAWECKLYLYSLQLAAVFQLLMEEVVPQHGDYIKSEFRLKIDGTTSCYTEHYLLFYRVVHPSNPRTLTIRITETVSIVEYFSYISICKKQFVNKSIRKLLLYIFSPVFPCAMRNTCFICLKGHYYAPMCPTPPFNRRLMPFATCVCPIVHIYRFAIEAFS